MDGAVGGGGTVDSGGHTSVGGRSGAAAGGWSGTVVGGADAADAGGVGGAGGGSGTRHGDADVTDAPGTGGASGSGGAPRTDGGMSTGGLPRTGGVSGAGGNGGGGTSTAGGTGGGGTPGAGGKTAAGGSTSPVSGPCDIYAAASPATPCVAAYSMVRVLTSAYAGPLYQVRKGGGSQNTGTGGAIADIGAKDGYADSAAQDDFCGGDSCTVAKLYDQSGQGNDLTVAPAGCYSDGSANTPDYESSATKHSLLIDGHKVYALYMNPHEGYRNNATSGMPTGNAAQGIYEVVDGKHFGTACCWDFGNASTNNCYGSVNTLSFGAAEVAGVGSGPWFMGKLGSAPWPYDPIGTCVQPGSCLNNPSMNMDYAFGVLKTSQTSGALRVGDARAGSLTTVYDGQVSVSLQLKGGIVLGISGENGNLSQGTFFEGAITAGRPSDATDAAILKNVQDAKYGQ